MIEINIHRWKWNSSPIPIIDFLEPLIFMECIVIVRYFFLRVYYLCQERSHSYVYFESRRLIPNWIEKKVFKCKFVEQPCIFIPIKTHFQCNNLLLNHFLYFCTSKEPVEWRQYRALWAENCNFCSKNFQFCPQVGSILE